MVFFEKLMSLLKENTDANEFNLSDVVKTKNQLGADSIAHCNGSWSQEFDK